MVNKKRTCIYIAMMMVFIVYLIFANQIVLCFDKDTTVKKAKMSDFKSNSEVIFSISVGENVGGMLEKCYMNGWAFCETEQDNTNKEINLLFKDKLSDVCYVVENGAQMRPDVYGVFRNEKKIYNGLNGLECQFSTISFKEGEYELFLYVKENESNYGVVTTGRIYKKTGDEFVYVN
ncbi:hypothetical protein HDR58_05975 [bacterium]|nr:hypothetical protein [bacterium]